MMGVVLLMKQFELITQFFIQTRFCESLFYCIVIIYFQIEERV